MFVDWFLYHNLLFVDRLALLLTKTKHMLIIGNGFQDLFATHVMIFIVKVSHGD